MVDFKKALQEKKMAKKGAAVKSDALAKYDAELAALAASATQMQSGVGSTGNFISIRAGVLSYQGTPIEGNKMNCIIVAAILENQYYTEAYDSDNPSSPACYAFGVVAKDMVPHEQASDPQHTDCHTCPQMQFGSADKGKGKACKACQRIMLITEGDLDNIESAELATLKLPFYSTIEYAAYVRQLQELKHRPPFCFITEISVHPDVKAQFKVKFKLIDEITDPDSIPVLLDISKRAGAEIAAPYPELTTKQNGASKRSAARPKPQAAKPAAKPAAKGRAPAPAAPTPAETNGKKVGLRRPVAPSRY